MHTFNIRFVLPIAASTLIFPWTARTLGQPAAEPSPTVVSSIAGDVRVDRLATLEFPWGMELLPDGRLLVTEKPGRLRVFDGRQLSEPVDGVPSVVQLRRQGSACLPLVASSRASQMTVPPWLCPTR